MYRNFHNKKKSNKLSRSTTRISLLEFCEKKYFLNYYTFALKKIDQSLRETGIINKKLKNLDMWMGEKTHYLISDYLDLVKNNEDNEDNIQKIKEGISEEMRDEFDLSKNKNFSSSAFGERGGLSEHYYGENADEKIEETIEKVKNNLDQLINSDWINKIKENISLNYPVYIENPKNPNFEAMRVDTRGIQKLRDISIMASPDFGIKFSDKKYLILDWKSAKEPEHLIGIPDQLKMYALKMILKKTRNTNIEDFDIETHEIYLPSINNYGGKIEQEDIDGIINQIIEDTNFQKKFLVDEDAYRNQPLPSTAFSRTTETEKCEKCPFRKVCNELKKFE